MLDDVSDMVRRSTARWAALWGLVVLVSLASPGIARASQGDLAIWLDTSLANAHAVTDEGPQLGAGAQVGALVGISDFWGLVVGLEGAYHFPVSYDEDSLDGMSVQGLFAGFRYNLDIFAYVPYVSLAIGEYLPGPPPEPGEAQRPTVGPRLTIGVDWRFDRYWSFGVNADLHALNFSVAPFPNYSTIGVALGYHFRL